MTLQLYTGPWIYDLDDKSVPASVRLRNLGAIGSTRDNHEARFGALASQELPASDGSQLPTPAFSTIYGGAAFWGHWVIRRAEIKPGVTNIANILKKYSTGNSDVYANTVARDSGLGMYEDIDLWRDPRGYHKLYDVMIAMSKWEAGARSSSAPGYEAYHNVYNLSDQSVVDELYWGLVHGLREGWRDAGYVIEATPEEPWVYETPKIPVEEVKETKQVSSVSPEKDPLLDFFSGYKTIFSGIFAFISGFFMTLFDTLGFPEAEKYASLATQTFLILVVVFLIVKFWKRFEKMVKRRLPK